VPNGAVLLVVDGLGASYIYPEYSPYALDGSPLPGAVLFNLTGGGARVLDVQVPVPETTKSHSVLITGRAEVDPESPGLTIFDAAHGQGYLCLAVLERGDSMPVLQEMDAVLYLDDNSMCGAQPVLGFRAGAAEGLSAVLQGWRDAFPAYTASGGGEGYAGYNAWALDCAADLVRHLSGQRFIILVNAGAVDSAGHNLGPDGYSDAIASLDAPLGRLERACFEGNVLLAVTADHGMVFTGQQGQGGHSAERYSSRPEALRIPLLFMGPGVEEVSLAGRWSEMDIAPTLLAALNISSIYALPGRAMPLLKGYDLRVTGAPAGFALLRGEERLAVCPGGDCCFLDLPRGSYSLMAGGVERPVVVNGDLAVDLGERASLPAGARRATGIMLILAINLAGIAAIVRIWRRG